MNNILPNFLICGAAKCGTTALYNYLDSHPDVLMSSPKEPKFFHENYDRGLDWYKKCFAAYDGESAVGEASVQTMTNPKSARRIKETLDSPKLIFILRNPIERAYSHYHYLLYNGMRSTPESFESLLINEKSKFSNKIKMQGLYNRQIPHFDNLFSNNQVKIIILKDFKLKEKETVNKIYSYIGVKTIKKQYIERKNITKNIKNIKLYYMLKRVWKPVRSISKKVLGTEVATLRKKAKDVLTSRKRPPMSDSAREYLRDFYSETIEWTRERTGRELDHWK